MPIITKSVEKTEEEKPIFTKHPSTSSVLFKEAPLKAVDCLSAEEKNYFKLWNREETERLLKGCNKTCVVIRPSSVGESYLAVTCYLAPSQFTSDHKFTHYLLKAIDKGTHRFSLMMDNEMKSWMPITDTFLPIHFTEILNNEMRDLVRQSHQPKTMSPQK